MSYRPNDGQVPSTVPVASTVTGGEPLLYFDVGTGLYKSMTPAMVATYALAHDGSADMGSLTPASAIPGDLVLVGFSAAAPAVPLTVTWASLQAGGTSGGTTPAYATTMTTSAPSTMTVGTAAPVTVTGGTGGLDPAKTFTPSAPVAGTFSPTSRVGNGTTALSFQFTPSAAGSGTFSATGTGVTATASGNVTIATGSGTAPSQVGSLTAGTPTSTTIPVTYTAATGTATISYTGQTRIHGSGGAYTNNGGTFTGTGGTFTGLTASTSYDLQITATNSAGSSTTVLTTGVNSAAGGGTSAFTMASPTYAARADGSGKQMLTGGGGSTTFTLPANGQWLIKVGVKGGTAANFTSKLFLKVDDGSGNYIAAGFSGYNAVAITASDQSGSPDTPAITDGGIHTVSLEAVPGTGSGAGAQGAYNVYADGTYLSNRGGNYGVGYHGAVTISIVGGGTSVAAGIFDVRVYDGSSASPGNLLGEWLLDGSGAAS